MRVISEAPFLLSKVRPETIAKGRRPYGRRPPLVGGMRG